MKNRTATFLIFLVGGFFVSACEGIDGNQASPMVDSTPTIIAETSLENVQDSLASIVTAFSDSTYVWCIGVASTPEVAVEVLQGQREMVYLLEHKEKSITYLREQYMQKVSPTDCERIAYYTFFGLAKDKEMRGELIDYLQSVKDLDPSGERSSIYHPYYHALVALDRIAGDGQTIHWKYDFKSDIDSFLQQIGME